MLPKAVMDVTLASASGEAVAFRATADHPWLVERAGGARVWVDTIDLAPGDRLVTEDADRLTFARATLHDDGALTQTYNLTVAGDHTFLVGEDGVVVHNDCPLPGVPKNWIRQLGKKLGHIKWVNPANKHDYVRIKPDGTVTQVRNGMAYDASGNLVPLSSPAAHGITPQRFIFR